MSSSYIDILEGIEVTVISETSSDLLGKRTGRFGMIWSRFIVGFTNKKKYAFDGFAPSYLTGMKFAEQYIV